MGAGLTLPGRPHCLRPALLVVLVAKWSWASGSQAAPLPPSLSPFLSLCLPVSCFLSSSLSLLCLPLPSFKCGWETTCTQAIWEYAVGVRPTKAVSFPQTCTPTLP